MKKIILFIALITTILSCTKLDTQLYDSIPAEKFPEDADQAALRMIPIYKNMSYGRYDGLGFLDGGGWWFCQELPSDEMVCPTRNTDWDDGGKWRVLHQHTWDNNTEAVVSMWASFYYGVVTANQQIELLAPGANTLAGKTAIAKLKIIRAYYYYLLIDNYGDVPFVTKFKEAEANPFKNKRAAIFDSIVNDVETNIPFLGSSLSKTAVSKGMAFSLLAKLYLNSAVYTGTPRWAKASASCDSVMKLGYKLETDPLAPFVTKNESSAENIFTIPFDENSNKGFNLHMRTLHYNSNLTFDMSVGPWNGFAAMESFYKTYSADDKRCKGNNTFGIGNNKGYFLVGQQFDVAGSKIADGGAANALLIFDPHIPALKMDASYSPVEIRMSGVRVVKFEIKTGATDNLSNDFPIFRYADILLMKSEALIRQGLSGDDPFNEVRNRAGIPPLTGVGLDSLLAERGREMFWEAHRRQDLIRFDKFNNAWWEKLADASTNNVFPIPQKQLDTNPNLKLDPK